jgi:adenylate kinase family enzyme
MPQYDFLNLSPVEFEILTRDLLQKEFNVHIESFADGTDGGIDLRFAKIKSKNEIIQCKRYKDFNSLFSNLKKEVVKVNKINPTKYYISTSVGLTPNQKGKIFSLFKPHIKSEADIFGKSDLNNLLGKYDDVESKNFKLWLSSTNILTKILHSKIYNQTQFEIEEIKEQVKLYVQNDSFNESLEILEKNRFVIISGIPGIGKTTLARILVYHLLSLGYEEFAYLNDSISEGFDVFQEHKKQVFLFDDFLGQNFLESSLDRNEDKNIIKFIEKIKKSKNKALIFTTREYILKQAQLKYEGLNKSLIDKSKCVIDLSMYTRMVKAQILYNHLFFSGLPRTYAEELLKDKFCLILVKHPNFNPRIIETFTKSKIWIDVNKEDFQSLLIGYFDNPTSVWEHAYENQITELSKCILAVLLTTNTPILYNDLLKATRAFSEINSKKYNIKTSESEFKKSLKELENTFLISHKDYNHKITIEYQNPSIHDFLVSHIGLHEDLIDDLISSAIFFNQLSTVFTANPEVFLAGELVRQSNKILLNQKLINRICERVLIDFDSFESSIIYRTNYRGENEVTWFKSNFTDLKKLSILSKMGILENNSSSLSFIRSKFLKLISNNEFEVSNDEVCDFINLLELLNGTIDVNPDKMIRLASSNLSWYSELETIESIGEIYPENFQDYKESNEFYDEVLVQILTNEFESADNNNLREVLDNLKTMESEYGVNATNEIEDISTRLERLERYQDDEIEFYEDDRGYQGFHSNEDELILDMFSSLKDE